MSSEDGVWPWGKGPHEFHGSKVAGKCRECEAVCTSPAHMLEIGESAEDAYAELCSCCREPLYQLRIAELESELGKATTCPMCDEGYPPHVCASYADLVTQVRTLTDFREGVRYVHQVHWGAKTPSDDELLEWVRRDHVQAAIAQRLSNDVQAFQQCDGFEVFRAPDGENGLRECRKSHWHRIKEGE